MCIIQSGTSRKLIAQYFWVDYYVLLSRYQPFICEQSNNIKTKKTRNVLIFISFSCSPNFITPQFYHTNSKFVSIWALPPRLRNEAKENTQTRENVFLSSFKLFFITGNFIQFFSLHKTKIFSGVYLYFCRRASKTFERFSAIYFLLCFNKKCFFPFLEY